jgi:hypothetical protein
MRQNFLGEDHPDAGMTLKNLAELYRDEGRVAESERLHSRASAVLEKTLGINHPDVTQMRAQWARNRDDRERSSEIKDE